MARTAAATQSLNVLVNGEVVRSHAANLAELIAELGYGDAKVATALNGEFVPREGARRPLGWHRTTESRSWRRARVADRPSHERTCATPGLGNAVQGLRH